MRADVEMALERFKINTFANKKNIERAESKLWGDEKVLYIAPTNAVIYNVNTKKKEKLPGIFTLTDRRVLFCYKAGFSESVESFELSEIKSIGCSGNGMTGGHINIDTVTKTLDILVNYKKETMQEIQDTIDQAMQQCKNPAPQSIGMQNDLEQIEKLHDLMEKGIITPEEFEGKKKQLLGL